MPSTAYHGSSSSWKQKRIMHNKMSDDQADDLYKNYYEYVS